MRHWRPYLWGRTFVVRTDHYALKYMLDQRLSTIPQHQWISKLFGFDFRVEYHPGRLNTVVDARSRCDGDMPLLTALSMSCDGDTSLLATMSMPTFALYDDLRQELAQDTELRARRDAVVAGNHDGDWSVCDGLIIYDGRVFVPPTSAVLPDILQLTHTAGHKGV